MYQEYIIAPFSRSKAFDFRPNEYDYSSAEDYKKDIEEGIVYDPYMIICFKSHLEPILRDYYDFTSLVLLDKEINNKMVSTIHLMDSKGMKIPLSQQDIKMIQNDIVDNIVKLNVPTEFVLFDCFIHPSYFLPALQYILPNIKLYDMEGKRINTIIRNDRFICVDLVNYEFFPDVIQYLYRHIDDWIKTEMDKTFKAPAGVTIDNVEGYYNHAMNLYSPVIQDTRIRVNVETPVPINPEEFTKYTLDFSNVNPYFKPQENIVGIHLMESLRKFAQCDKVLLNMNENNPGQYNFILIRDDEPIRFDIDIDKIIGYQYFTDDCRGLLILKSRDMLMDFVYLEEKISGRIGLFVPIMYNGNYLNINELQDELDNSIDNIDVYINDFELLFSRIARLKLNYLDMIDGFVFVKKDDYFSQRTILRTLKDTFPQVFIYTGTRSESDIQNIIDNILSYFPQYENISNQLKDIKKGPFDTMLIPVIDREYLKGIYEYL